MECRVIGMWGGFPKKNGPCSGYLIQHEDFSLLIDCGSGVLTELQNYADLNNINHVILTHYHYDHFSDIGAYLFSRLVNTHLGRADEELCVYGPKDEGMKKQVEDVAYSRFTSFNEKSRFEIGPFICTFMKNIHPVETYSIKIECDSKSIIFTSDTSFTPDLISFAANSDLLITECSLYGGMDGTASGHMTSEHAGILAYQSNAKKVLLTHLPHYGDLNDLVVSAKKQGNENIVLAESGMLIQL
ncbi:MBL fold metallo-hydrolase [Psychrobacillus sp. NEAU-3TGS]|uniref:MBL fold metallo-hydrolase n=1 Tax=Psychrobacillus sp. NEAU-3TGS TaxID=2995412 RepID=UPI002499A452|nr:MBL fold metallo-hydrolase [Psychrobacillus sp. NEAU-3TGS]MDI2585603.1 MBL fold metallo-hydrolase [Psychrobacillus sp. NEAU-3TGS]